MHHGDRVTIGDTTFVVESDPPYPNPRQPSGLPGLAEDEPPPTARLDGPGAAPAPSAAPAAVVAPPSAQARRMPVLSLAIGGCLALVLLAICCALGFFAATAGGPALLTALAPPARRSATPGAAAGAGIQLPAPGACTPALKSAGAGARVNAPAPTAAPFTATPPPAGRVLTCDLRWSRPSPGLIRSTRPANGPPSKQTGH